MSERSSPGRVSSTPGRALLKLSISGLMLAVLYGAAYGVARWRKYIVMSAYCNADKSLIVMHPQPGFDLRSGWRGQARNDALFAVFRPLCALEVLVRGGRRPIP